MGASVTVQGKVLEAEAGETAESVMRRNGYVPDAYLYVVDGKPVPMDTPIVDGMAVRAMKVASGG